MWKTVPLVEEYRGGLLECVHEGMICLVDENGVVASLGSEDFMCYYRSASKLLQSLPALMLNMPEKFGLSVPETIILSGSHGCEREHVEALEGILAKTGLSEDDLVMNACYSDSPYCNEIRAAGGAPRKIYHNCAGKHLCMMMVARELGMDVRDYWKAEGKVQQMILKILSDLTDTPVEDIYIGTDGCGVPVYAVPFHKIAVSYMRLANPHMIADEQLRAAVEKNWDLIHQKPMMIASSGAACTRVNASPDMISKDGALGVFAIGFRKPAMGLVMKIGDGVTHPIFDVAVGEALRVMGYMDIAETMLHAPNSLMHNDLGMIVGERKACFGEAWKNALGK